ncbi:hypothetical protein KUTG_05219, partial [Kutzneria sp. 744]
MAPSTDRVAPGHKRHLTCQNSARPPSPPAGAVPPWCQIEPTWLAVVPCVCHSGAMDLTTYVSNLGREFATLAEANGEEARALVERLTGSLESAIRMTLLETLSAASDEITSELAPGSVELRLRGRDPQFVVSVP